MPAYLQMMPSGMMPSGWDWGSVWLMLIVPSLVVGVVLILLVALFLRREEGPSRAQIVPDASQAGFVGTKGMGNVDASSRPDVAALAGVLRSLAPTLMDDERRVMDELVKAGGEVLQSDLPRLTDFSKATVSKAVHGLEVRGIVVREKHKWTYWCKVNPRLIERTLQEEAELQESKPLSTGPVA